MTYDGHFCSSHIYLDGVDFKFSDIFTSRSTINLPEGFDLKDPDVLLEDLHYDFTLERRLTEDLRRQRLDEEKRSQHEKEERDRQREELALKHRRYLLEREEKLREENENNSRATNDDPAPMKISPGNPFFDDMIGNTILTPQPAQKPDVVSPKTYNNLDINDFETDNLDPFSNMELRTLDDMKELKDVLQKVTNDINTNHTYTNPSVASNHHTNHHSSLPSNNNNNVAVETEIPAPPENQPSTSKKKLFLLDEFTDILTTDCENKLSEDVNLTRSVPAMHERLSDVQFSSPDLNENHNSVTTPPLDSDTSIIATSKSVPLLRKERGSPVTVLDSNSVAYTKPRKNTSLPNVAAQTLNPANKTEEKSPEFEKKPRNLAPIPRPRPKLQQGKENVNKSAHEKVKFEETIIKALSSLPQLPKPKPLKKPPVPPIIKHRSSSLVEGLTAEERQFINSFVEMGFSERDVIRSMQKYGQDQKKVLNHMCAVQELCGEGFKTSNVEEVMEMFADKAEVKAYLSLQRQFLDMGFSCEKVNQALLLNDKDHTKALDALMASS